MILEGGPKPAGFLNQVYQQVHCTPQFPSQTAPKEVNPTFVLEFVVAAAVFASS